MDARGAVVLRRAAPDDLAAVARIHVASSQAAYRDLLPASWLSAFTVPDRQRQLTAMLADPAYRGTIVLGEVEGSIAAFVQVGPSRDDGASDEVGEVWTMYAAEEHWGSGVAGPVLAAGVRVLRTAGHETCTLWVLEANARARRFYERHGWSPDGTSKVLGTDVSIRELRYRLGSGAPEVPSASSRRTIIDCVD